MRPILTIHKYNRLHYVQRWSSARRAWSTLNEVPGTEAAYTALFQRMNADPKAAYRVKKRTVYKEEFITFYSLTCKNHPRVMERILAGTD